MTTEGTSIPIAPEVRLTEAESKEVEEGKYHTVKEIAQKLGYVNAWISWLCAAGRIKAIKPLGGAWRIPDSEYKRIMEKGLPSLPRESRIPAGGPIIVPKEVEQKIVEKPKEEEKGKEELKFPWNLFEI